MELLKSPATVKNCIGWFFNPLPQVGSTSGDLTTTPYAMDAASRTGSKSQQYTSWDCLSRSYVCGGTIHETDPNALTPGPVLARGTGSRRIRSVGDAPTEAELAQMDENQRNCLEEGTKIFLRGVGVLTRKQAEKHLAKSTQTQESESGSKRVTRSAPETDLGFFYSDTIPVRVLAVNSMTARREEGLPTPYSPTFQALAGRLNDPAQTGVLAAVVRSPNVRDATTLTSLVKAVLLRPSTTLEIAPMVRALAMSMSLAVEAYQTDPICYRFMRRVKSRESFSGPFIRMKTSFDPKAWHAMAMPLDTFVAMANNSYSGTAHPRFKYCNLDVSWTAVPVPTRMLGQPHLFPYIAAFLSSSAWTGTVNYTVSQIHNNVRPTRVNYTLMPSINSIMVDGPTDVCLVLIDETSQSMTGSHVKLFYTDTSVSVPVFTGQAVEPVSFGALWPIMWSERNHDRARTDCMLAYNEICARLGVHNACGTALSIVAELYGVAYQGVGLTRDKQGKVKRAYGSWSFDGLPLDKDGLIPSMKVHTGGDNLQMRRMTSAYNFSGLSPLHLCPSGVHRVRFRRDPGVVWINWESDTPYLRVPTYNVTTMTSVFRIAVAMDLVMTHDGTYRFPSARGLTHWVHMLSSALAFSKSAFLGINDLSTREWAGMDERYDRGHRSTVYNDIYDSLYSGVIVRQDPASLYSSIAEWDLDANAEYWTVSAYDNSSWMSYSPVPYHCTLQWIEKLSMTGGVAPAGVTQFRHQGADVMAIRVGREALEHKIHIASSIDVARRLPRVYIREPDQPYAELICWVDCVSAYSNAGAGSPLPQDWNMFETMTLTLPHTPTGISHPEDITWLVAFSNYEYADPQLYITRVTPIAWPDPPILETLWTGAKNLYTEAGNVSLGRLLDRGAGGGRDRGRVSRGTPAGDRPGITGPGENREVGREGSGESGQDRHGHDADHQSASDGADHPPDPDSHARTDSPLRTGGRRLSDIAELERVAISGREPSKRITSGTFLISGERTAQKLRVPVAPSTILDLHQLEYSSVLSESLWDALAVDRDKVRLEPRRVDKLRRYSGRSPAWWPIPHHVTCSWGLYLTFQAYLRMGQRQSSLDLITICRTIAGAADVYPATYQSDYWRHALKGLSTYCFPRVFSHGPKYMLFVHLHTLTAKAPYTREQILGDIQDWVSPRLEGVDKAVDGATVERVLDRLFAQWYRGETFGALTFRQFANDFMRWGTSGGAPRVEYAGQRYRSKWAWALRYATDQNTGDLLPSYDLYARALKEKKICNVALKEEPAKTREVITTPMSSYLRQSYLMYRWGKPRIPSPISTGSWLADFEARTPRWYGSIDGEKFDQTVPKEFIIGIVRRLGSLDSECAAVAADEIQQLEDLWVQWGEDRFKWEGGLLSGWRLTSLIGSLLSCCVAEYIIEKTSSLGAMEYGVMGDDLILYSHTMELSPETMVQLYNSFGLRANLAKTCSGPTGEFLRRVHSMGGVWAYPALGLKSALYASPWLDKYTYDEESEVSNTWLTWLSRLLPHSLTKHDTCTYVLTHLKSNLNSNYGKHDWDSWLSTPICAGGGGSLEFSDVSRWCYLDKVVPIEKVPRRLYLAYCLGVLAYKRVLKDTPVIRELDIAAVVRRAEQLQGGTQRYHDTNFRHNVSVTETLTAFLHRRIGLSDLNAALNRPLPRGLRATSPRRVVEFLLQGVKTHSGLTTIQHTKDTVSGYSDISQSVTRALSTEKRFRNIRHLSASATLYMTRVLRSTCAVYGTW